MITSKKWDKLYEDPLHIGQRWSCSCCTRYMAAYGVICELRTRGVEGVQYSKTEVPDGHVQDARALFFEDTINPESPGKLYAKVPAVGPTCTEGVITIRNLEPGEYTITKAFDKQLPNFEWADLLHLCGKTLPPTSQEQKVIAKKLANGT
jgi:hypothetical protein